MNQNKYWIGIGISNSYLEIIDELKIIIKKHDHDTIVIIANQLTKKYNNKLNLKILKKIQRKLNTLTIKSFLYNFLSEKKEYKEILEKIILKFKNNEKFKEEVIKLVIQNRNDVNSKNIQQRSGYVLEELAATKYMFQKKYIKLGKYKKEKPFDDLSNKYLSIPLEAFEYF